MHRWGHSARVRYRAGRHVLKLLILLGAVPAQLSAQSEVLLQSAVGFGVLTRGDFDRRTGVLVLEGRASMPTGPLSLGAGVLWGTYESLEPVDRSRVSHFSFFAEARRDFGLGGSPYLVGLAGRLGYDLEDDGNQEGNGVMYGVSVGLARRLTPDVALGVSGLSTWYSLGRPIGDGRLLAVRLEVQASP
jgi:hypothetical protein